MTGRTASVTTNNAQAMLGAGNSATPSPDTGKLLAGSSEIVIVLEAGIYRLRPMPLAARS